MTKQCALVNLKTGKVENIIMAEPDDPVETDHIIIAEPPDWVTIGVQWEDKRFLNPHAYRRIKGAEFL
jgi:hypothetical protein